MLRSLRQKFRDSVLHLRTFPFAHPENGMQTSRQQLDCVAGVGECGPHILESQTKIMKGAPSVGNKVKDWAPGRVFLFLPGLIAD